MCCRHHAISYPSLIARLQRPRVHARVVQRGAMKAPRRPIREALAQPPPVEQRAMQYQFADDIEGNGGSDDDDDDDE